MCFNRSNAAVIFSSGLTPQHVSAAKSSFTFNHQENEGDGRGSPKAEGETASIDYVFYWIVDVKCGFYCNDRLYLVYLVLGL